MAQMQLKIITPARVVENLPVTRVMAPSTEGDLTILPHHEHLFTLLAEGIISYQISEDEREYLAIGGGYLETDGSEVTILVSRAYGQNELDQKMIEQAEEQAKKVLSETKDSQERAQAIASLRRSTIDRKLLTRRPRRRGSSAPDAS